ncbi:MAG: HD-GYP domain-containing protein [Chloroflexi bacterium]|nr:HD-GYP domain-containing protein [Chloroflexota bacterium]
MIVPLAAYIFLRGAPALDSLIGTPLLHFQIVSATFLIALLLSIAIGIAGIRQRNLQVIYVSLAFISLAGLFSVHGLATPGFIFSSGALVGVAAQLSVLTMGFWLLLSSLPVEHPLSAWLSTRAKFLLPLWTPAIVIAGIYALNNPAVVEWVPVTQAPLRGFVTVITIFFAGVSAYRYWQSYRYSRFPFQLAMTYVGGWIAVSQIIIATGQTFYLSWWIYHFLLLFAVLAVILGLIVQYSSGQSLRLSVQGLFSSDPRDRLEAGLSPSIRALIAATEARDPYTAGHSERVALGAIRLGTALHFSPEDLRVLAHSGLVHDIGKLQVPDKVLNKPGKLDTQERKIIELHPITGYELCARLGFMPPELQVIRHHHERLDGNGYPDKLTADRLSRLVRVLSVVDVYDALTTSRSYRPAWSRAEAIKYLQEHAGTQFDPEYVEVWINLENNHDK